jgi:Rrf2 family protein
MLISQANDYAARSLIYMTQTKNKKFFTTKEISKNLNISRTFITKIFQKLVKNGILFSVKGRNGGFTLVKDAKKITLYDVFHSVDGIPFLRECVYNKRACFLSANCSMNSLYKKRQKVFHRELKKITIEKLKNKK